MKAFFLILSLALASEPKLDPESAAREKEDRRTDRIALTLQNELIAKVSALAKRHVGSSQEPVLLMRLLESTEQAANLEFRIAHFNSHINGTALDLSSYQKRLKEVTDSASTLIKSYPNSPDIARITFSRAQALSELKNDLLAKKDYELVAESYPKTTFAIRSNLWLAGYATDLKDHARAIGYLKRVEAEPQDNHYPFALYQLAWAYYNLSQISQGLAYLKLHISYYQKQMAAAGGTLPASEQAYLEHSIRDVVTFYFEGFHGGLSGYTIENAVPTFTDYNPGPYFGKMLVSFAKLLRSRDLEKELNDWTELVIARHGSLPESLDTVLVKYDYLVLRSSGFEKMTGATENISALDDKTKHGLSKWDAYPRAQKYILQTITELQKAITAAESTEDKKHLGHLLLTAISVFAKISPGSDPKVVQVHYNLAEMLFAIQDYEQSEQQYQWVIQNWNQDAGLTLFEIKLKAISCRHQSLLAKGVISKDLKAMAIEGPENPDLSKLDPAAAEWIGWLDAYIKEFGRTSETVDKFEFEAARLLYSKNQSRAGIARMLKLVNERPASKISPAAASLVLDTHVFAQDWSRTQGLADDFSKKRDLGDTAFKQRIKTLSGDASYKSLEGFYASNDFSKVLKASTECSENGTERSADCLFLAGRASQKMGDSEKAAAIFTKLLENYPNSEHRPLALLARAGIRETIYDFEGASQDYKQYLTTTKKADGEIAKRAWFTNWLSKRPQPVDCQGYDLASDLGADCDKFRALAIVASGQLQLKNEEVVKKATRGPNRALWAAIGLHVGRQAALSNQWILAERLATGWKDLDPLIQFTLIPVLNDTLPKVFLNSRHGIPKLERLKSNSRSLARRIELIKQLEAVAGKVVEVPWAKVKIAALTEVAEAYLDFCSDLQRLPRPKDLPPEEAQTYEKSIAELVSPFQEKGKAIQSQAKLLLEKFPTAEALDPGLVSGIDTKGPLQRLWMDALKTKTWPRLAFFFQEIKRNGELKDDALTRMRALSLDNAGANAEAHAELGTAHNRMPAAQVTEDK